LASASVEESVAAYDAESVAAWAGASVGPSVAESVAVWAPVSG
jgi:hypothetical protein